MGAQSHCVWSFQRHSAESLTSASQGFLRSTPRRQEFILFNILILLNLRFFFKKKKKKRCHLAAWLVGTMKG